MPYPKHAGLGSAEAYAEYKREYQAKAMRKWREKTSTPNERTKQRTEHRKQQDEEWGMCVYMHKDPITDDTVYVGSGKYSRATTCRTGGGTDRSEDHKKWYRWHRKNGTIKTHHDYVVILHRNIHPDMVRSLEGSETMKALIAGTRLFNKELPNPSPRVYSAKDMVRHSQQ